MSRTLRLSLLVMLLLLAACATTGGSGPAPVDDGMARAHLERGDFRAAAEAYAQLAASNRAQRDLWYLHAAEALREEGDWVGVVDYTGRIKRKRLNADASVRLDVLLAELALSQNDAQAALDLATIPEQGQSRPLRVRAAEVRARALAASGRPLDAVTERVRLATLLEPSERAGNEEDLLNVLAGIEVDTLNAELGKREPADPLRPWIERALRLKGVVAARPLIHPTRQVGTLMPSERSQDWEREGYTAAQRVALLLPLSGELSAVSNAILDGFFAAYFAEQDQAPDVQVFDTGDTPESAVAAYQLAVRQGANRVVGPLARDQIAPVLAAAEQSVPVLALNHPDNGAAPPLNSQQFGLLPDDEAALAAEYAHGRGLMHAAIFAGTEEWSERAALAFRAQFEQLGGVVVGDARLPADGVDFSTSIAQATATAPDVFFFALRPNQGRLLVPQLRTRALDTLPMLATSHIYIGSSNRALDRDLDGVEFCDAPWVYGLAAGMPSRDALSRKLPAAGASPRLFAFGMDAYRLLPYLDWLSRNSDAYMPGASGQLAVDAFGRVRRFMTWMRFVEGIPRAADGALSTDQGMIGAQPP